MEKERYYDRSRRNLWDKTKSKITAAASTVALLGVVAGGAVTGASFVALGVCNSLFNNRVIDSPAYRTISRSTGLFGHIEYTKYKDGSEDIKEYPSFINHRLASSKLYQNLDGDDTIDRIRVHCPGWKLHRLNNILVRQTDYESNKKAFLWADRLLARQRLIAKQNE